MDFMCVKDGQKSLTLCLHYRLPDGPWGLPFFGVGFQMDFSKHIDVTLQKWRKKYGEIYSITLPYSQDVVVVSLTHMNS